MTTNQLRARELQEQERSNRAREQETHRSNRVNERVSVANAVTGGIGNVGKALGGLSGLGGLLRTMNDPSWYNLDPQLVKDVASLSYYAPLGTGHKYAMASTRNNVVANENRSIPGVMCLNMVPTLGKSGGATSAATIASQNIYAYVRHANSGHTNYESPDLMMYLLAMDSVYTWFSHLVKVYSIALTAKSENRYYPKGILYAMDIDAEDVISKLANFRARLNVAAMRINAFNVPAQMPLYKRHCWLVMNIFKDLPIKRSQEYVFAPTLYHQWGDDGNVYAHYLPSVIAGRRATVDDLFSGLEAMLNALIASEDIGIMSGDILKAYGESGLFKVGEIPESFHIESTYSQEVLTQINAAEVFPGYEFKDGAQTGGAVPSTFDYRQLLTGEIYQGAGTEENQKQQILTRYFPTADGSVVAAYVNSFINMYKDEVSPDDNMVATRLCAHAIGRADVENSKFYLQITTCGSEIITGCNIVNFNPDTRVFEGHAFSDGEKISITVANQFEYLRNMADFITKFDWAPMLRAVVNNGGSSTTDKIYRFNYDVANYVIIDTDILDRLHSVALLSEFGVPLLGNAKRR